ncbi:phosphoribosyl-AMP cyclohydrolase [Halorussus sp. AFM4]|uniref:phosphoribosyl-AMP cyclohydrolase n=1 Tax=Halorussus sp. AFM4 TaxID=3421651 RepID=UPI003EB805AD
MSDAPSAEGVDDVDESNATAADDADATDAAELVDLDFGETGRIPAVAQDADTGEVLMLAYVTREAVEETRETGLAHYYSRSREELWRKGATSGHVQRVREVRVDCDGDALLYLVDQEGGACHTGYESCFHRTLDGEVVGEQVFDPEDVYE